MDLFSNKTVIGLFDNQEDLGQALSKLHKQGFGEKEDDLVLIDEHHLAGANPFMQQGLMEQGQQFIVAPASSSGVGGAAVVGDASMPDEVSETALEEKLTDLGIDESEADFYARQVNRGNTLLVVETDDEQAQKVYDIMREANGKSSIS
jgi:hypothetical protein